MDEYSGLEGVPWEDLTPNDAGDWLNQRDDVFETFTPLGNKDRPSTAIFMGYSAGLKSNRDAWVYNPSRVALSANVGRMVAFHNEHVNAFKNANIPASDVASIMDFDATRTSWNRADSSRIARGVRYAVRDDAVRVSTYRPFNKQYLYFDRELNDMTYKLETIFPASVQRNEGFY